MKTLISTHHVQRVCAVCGQMDQLRYLIDVDRDHPEKPERDDVLSGVHEVFVCKDCGFLHNPGNQTKDLTDRDHRAPRLGTEDKPGREFAYAEKALPFLGRGPSRVMVFGSGVSLDYKHIAKLPVVSEVTVGDLENYMNAERFIDIRTPQPDVKFDLVIASEVVEHFEDPMAHFAALMDWVAPNGLAIIGTNFTGGMPISRLGYPFYNGHVCMWSEGSIHRIARHLQTNATIFLSTVGGVRKRAIAMTRSEAMDTKLKRHFERRKYLI